MDQPHITQQTSTTLPLAGGLTREAPRPKSLLGGTFDGACSGRWRERAGACCALVADFVLLCVAVIVALGGVHATLNVSAVQAPLLALPPLAMGLLYLRGLYRTRLRALVLDGVVPVLSAVSIAAMAVATIGLLANGQAPERVRRRARVAVRADRAWVSAASLCPAPSAGRAGVGLSASRC